ncbi:MAG: Fic family protein [Ignavibacteria bacterium]|nr:Fic family protein [Ignavibacteria bacterium]
MFADIKQVYHLLESLGSARIEGNRTTIDELVEAAVNGVSDSTEGLREISNLEDAMSWIESVFAEESHRRIDHSFLQELHRLTVKNLRPPEVGGEGDPSPGRYRSGNVAITGTSFVPPPGLDVPELMDRFISFINEPIDVRRS